MVSQKNTPFNNRVFSAFVTVEVDNSFGMRETGVFNFLEFCSVPTMVVNCTNHWDGAYKSLRFYIF